jgi:hypothetical protein
VARRFIFAKRSPIGPKSIARDAVSTSRSGKTREEPLTLKEIILEAIAVAYCTIVSEVSADISAMSIAEQQLNQFCEAMEDAGY